MSGYEQLIEILNDPEKFEENCKKVFDEIDIKKNGILEKNEIKKHMNDVQKYLLGNEIDNEIFEKVFNSYDKDHDGIINYDEFKPYFKNMLEKMIDILE